MGIGGSSSSDPSGGSNLNKDNNNINIPTDFNYSTMDVLTRGPLIDSIINTLKLSASTADSSQDTPIFSSIDLPVLPGKAQLTNLQNELSTAISKADNILSIANCNMAYLRNKYGLSCTKPLDSNSTSASNDNLNNNNKSSNNVDSSNNKITLKVKMPLGKDDKAKNDKDKLPIASRSGENGKFEMHLYSDGKLTARLGDRNDPSNILSNVADGSITKLNKKKKKQLKLEKLKKKASGSSSGLFEVSSNVSSGASTPTGFEFDVFSSIGDLTKKTRNKVTNLKPAQPNSISTAVFWPFVDSYFKPVTEDDIKFLRAEEDNVTPYVIPPLGKWYTEQWTEEDRSLYAQPLVLPNAEYGEVEDGVVPGDVHLPSIVERVYSCLMPEIIINREQDQDDLGIGRTRFASKRSSEEMTDLEQRLKLELQHIGLLSGVEGTGEHGEDELCSELRKLQEELKSTTEINQKRKNILADIATEWLGWEEYNELLDDINKKLISQYIKQYKSSNKGKHKRKSNSISGKPVPPGTNGESTSTESNTENNQDSAINTTQKIVDHTELYRKQRQRIIDLIGVYLPSEKFTIPSESIYKSLEENDEDDDEDDDDDNGSGSDMNEDSDAEVDNEVISEYQ